MKFIVITDTMEFDIEAETVEKDNKVFIIKDSIGELCVFPVESVRYIVRKDAVVKKIPSDFIKRIPSDYITMIRGGDEND